MDGTPLHRIFCNETANDVPPEFFYVMAYTLNPSFPSIVSCRGVDYMKIM